MKKIACIAGIILCGLTASAQSWPGIPPEARPGARWYVHGSAFTKEDIVRNLDEYARAGLGYLELTCIYGVGIHRGRSRQERDCNRYGDGVRMGVRRTFDTVG